MKLYEKGFVAPLIKDNKELLKYFKEYFLGQFSDEIPIRFVITKTDEKGYHCELGILSEINNLNTPSSRSIFDFEKRPYENNEKFNVALVIPTGIDAELGGHAGDAGALVRLVASACDTLITHPNVVNASDINELPENALYIEGSILSRLMMGTIGLQKVRANRLEVIIDKHDDEYFTNAAINSVNAARSSMGIFCNEIVILEKKFEMISKYSTSGRAVGVINDLEQFYNLLVSKKDEYNAIAISSVINVDPLVCEKYYSGGLVNPWGGVEATLTHTLSFLLDIPSAHSPMGFSKKTEEMDFGLIDPRMAAEVVSVTYLYSILKGLHKSPKIFTDQNFIHHQNLISAKDINCLVIPNRCLGFPTLAALEQGIPTIAVKENRNLMENNLNDLPWEGKLIEVENYWEAIGAIHALKSGVSIDSVRRPLDFTKVVREI